HYTAMAGLTVYPHANPGATGAALSTDLLASIVAIVAFLVSGAFLLTLVPERSVPLATPGPAPLRARDALNAVGPDLAVPADLGQGTYAPLGGAGTPRRRPARHLPVERGGAPPFLALGDIAAIHANAHYTTVCDGSGEFFCPLSIGEVEQRLDSSRFLRVHRSHIVNLQRVAALKRAGDNGLIELAGNRAHTVPVSRNRMNWLK